MQAELSHAELGTLVLGCDPYVVVSLQIGSPEVRDVTRNRSLADGVLDDTRYLGGRAISMAIRLNDVDACTESDMQVLIDRLTPYMSPRRRCVLSWQLPRSTEQRAALVRGASWPYTIQGPKAQSIALQWVAPTGEIMAGGPDAQICTLIKPTSDTEAGRTYNLTFNRVYPPSGPIGGRRIDNPGTQTAHWTLTIYGPVVNPKFTINGVLFAADRRGGVTLAVGQTLNVRTRDRTVLFNALPSASRYQNVNYEEWSWDDLLLRPGTNVIRFEGSSMTSQTAAEICYTPTYL